MTPNRTAASSSPPGRRTNPAGEEVDADIDLPALQSIPVPSFALEDGTALGPLEQGYRVFGRMAPRKDNVVLALHSLTGDTDVTAWWPGVVGPGQVLDPARWAVVAPNLLGSCYGTTPLVPVPEGKTAPVVTPRDQARFIAPLLDHLGVQKVALVTGGSLGGMVAMEWAATFPQRARAAVVYAAPAAHSAQAMGWNHLQREAVRLGGTEGLALARMVGMMIYRTGSEFGQRFHRNRTPDGEFQVRSYLNHHGEKLKERFDAAAYTLLLEAMDAHDVGRGRGGVCPALRAFPGVLVGVGIPGDILYPAHEVKEWAREGGARYREIHALEGHDSFLTRPGQVSEILAEALKAA